MWQLVTPGTGGRAGGGAHAEAARLSPNYLTVSADVWRSMGAPKYVTVEVDARQRAIRVTPTIEDQGTFVVGDNHRNREDGRRRISVGRALTLGGFTDVRKGGEKVDCTVNPDKSAVFKLR